MYDLQQYNNRLATHRSGKSELNVSAEGGQEEYVLSPQGLFVTIRKRMWTIMLVTLICVGVAVGFSLLQTPKYEASIDILISKTEGSMPDPSLLSEVQGLQQMTQTMTEAVNSRPIAEAVIRQLGLGIDPGEFKSNLEATQVGNTQFIRVNYTDTSPERAQEVVDTIGDQFSKQISDLSPTASDIKATVWARAEEPSEPTSPKPIRNGVLALALGVVLGVMLALLTERWKDSRRLLEEVERTPGTPTSKTRPEYEVQRGKKEGGRSGPNSPENRLRRAAEGQDQQPRP